MCQVIDVIVILVTIAAALLLIAWVLEPESRNDKVSVWSWFDEDDEQ